MRKRFRKEFLLAGEIADGRAALDRVTLCARVMQRVCRRRKKRKVQAGMVDGFVSAVRRLWAVGKCLVAVLRLGIGDRMRVDVEEEQTLAEVVSVSAGHGTAKRMEVTLFFERPLASPSVLITFTTPDTVTTSPGMHESTRSSVSSHSTVRGIRPSSRLSSVTISWIRTRCQSVVVAVRRSGMIVLLLQVEQVDGASYFPSVQCSDDSEPHLVQTKFMATST
eukprot:626758-Rhodomonas_salina.3